MDMIKRIAARLPLRWQMELRRLHYARQMRQGRFTSSEPEFKRLDHHLRVGDWVIDIGANVGQYTRRFSDLVGPTGRVLAFEPVPATFALLAANAQSFPYQNVTLINCAISDKLDVVGMSMPRFATGLPNFYEAHISSAAENPVSALALPLDSLGIEHQIALVKIDVEGHEAFVLAGMQQLIARSRPLLIIETASAEVISRLAALGYTSERLPGSPNMIFSPGM